MRIALLISGGGTTARHIIDACRLGQLPGVTPALVIASRADIGGIAQVKQGGVPDDDVIILRPKDFSLPAAFGESIIEACRARGVDFIGQYGWLCKTPPNVIEAFPGMMVNQHPGPLDPGRPDFGGPGMYGLRVHFARLYFVRHVRRDFWSEATAQRVTPEYDQGAILGIRRVPILHRDDAPALQQRMLPEEHALQVQVLRDFITGRVTELSREMPLVQAGEEHILEEAKAESIRMFPKG